MSNPTRIPSIYASILFQSRVNPFATAVNYDSKEVSYRQFCVDIEKVTRRLHRMELPPGSRVVVHIHHIYLRWLANIALVRMGMLSSALSDSGKELEFLNPRLVLTDRPGNITGRTAVEAGSHWLSDEANDWPAFEDFEHDINAPCRMVVSSGTTGLPKKAVLTYGDLRNRVRGTARTYGLNATARLMTTMGTATVGGFSMPVSCWSSGGACLLATLPPGQPISHVLAARPNVLFMAPGQLAALLETLPRDYWPWQHLVVYVAGSTLPPAVSRAARARLTQSLFIIYGSTETGTVTLTHAAMADERPGFIGYVIPGAQVQIVDDQGQRVANGKMGEIRIQSDGLVAGYADEPGVTDEAFREGWFYPGDAGVMDNEGGLRIVGRTRELMNLGGVKIAPELIEQSLASVPGIADMAVFALSAPAGDQPWVAVIPEDGFVDSALVQQFAKAFPRLPLISVARIDKIPRNEMGKVMRTQLAATVQNAIARTGTETVQLAKPSA